MLYSNRFVAKAIVVNSNTYWSPSLPIAIPCSFLSLLSFVLRCLFPSASRVRSIVHRTSWHVSKCGKKGEASEYCCVRVGKSFTPPSLDEKKMKGTKSADYIVRISNDFYFPHFPIIMHHNARCLLYSPHIFHRWKCWTSSHEERCLFQNEIINNWILCNCKRKVGMNSNFSRKGKKINSL